MKTLEVQNSRKSYNPQFCSFNSSNQVKEKKEYNKFGQTKATFYTTKIFDNEFKEKSLNSVIYGQRIKKLWHKQFFHYCIFYIKDDDSEILQWISEKKNYNESRINLNDIVLITDDPTVDSNILKYFNAKFKNFLFIIFQELNRKPLILKFKNKEQKFLWWQGMQNIILMIRERNMMNHEDYRIRMANKLFNEADKDDNKLLDFKEIKLIFQKLNIEINEKKLKEFFQNYDKDNNLMIDFNEYNNALNDLFYKSELEEIFFKYSSCNNSVSLKNTKYMNIEDMKQFFLIEQNENLSEKKLKKIIARQNKNTEKTDCFNFSEFSTMIFSIRNSIFDPKKRKIYQDMNRPLSDYYINSSHNTYLTANQISSDSSSIAYINAFAKGCRSVELDIWDGEKGEPTIFHGYTMTSKILFEDAVKIIDEYAFQKNPYPIILSLENHCKYAQQEKISKILLNIFGDKLFILPHDYEKYDKLPSPNELRNKVLIKDKGKIGNFSDEIDSDFESELNIQLNPQPSPYYKVEDEDLYSISKQMNIEKILNKTALFCKNESNLSVFTCNLESSFKSDGLSSEESVINSKKKIIYDTQTSNELNLPKKNSTFSPTNSPLMKKSRNCLNKKNSQIKTQKSLKQEKSNSPKNEKHPLLLNIISLFGVKLNFKQDRTVWEISSFKESKSLILLQKNESLIINYNKRCLTRVYPSGKRMNSSNYDCIPSFCIGSQLISLNFQTCDIGLLIYLSKFEENGGINCGYVLKPTFLQNNSNKIISEINEIKVILKIRIISGYQLRLETFDENDVVDPYVTINIKGISLDEKNNNKAFKTKTIKNNGFNPIFNFECEFKIVCPELCFIIFQVFDEERKFKNDRRMGWFCIPFNCIRTGYRIVPLINSLLNPIDFSYLLCNINVQYL